VLQVLEDPADSDLRRAGYLSMRKKYAASVADYNEKMRSAIASAVKVEVVGFF
jgi:hypothetical protein